MSLTLVLRREARAEFDAAYDWYEEQRPRLGVRFADRVQSVFDRICEMPESHATVFGDVRKALVRPFPYSIFYRVRPGRVVVIAVFHSKRDPKAWQSRA